MRHFIQEADQCLLYSASMVLDIEPDELIEELGHDGLDVWWPQFNDARKFRGHNMQEIIDCAIRRRIAFFPIDACPMQAPVNGAPQFTFESRKYAEERFLSYLSGTSAILVGQLPGSNIGHAVAWNGERVLDPNDVFTRLTDFSIKTAWVAVSF